jgi:hypothetical protein
LPRPTAAAEHFQGPVRAASPSEQAAINPLLSGPDRLDSPFQLRAAGHGEPQCRGLEIPPQLPEPGWLRTVCLLRSPISLEHVDSASGSLPLAGSQRGKSNYCLIFDPHPATIKAGRRSPISRTGADGSITGTPYPIIRLPNKFHRANHCQKRMAHAACRTSHRCQPAPGITKRSRGPAALARMD